MTNHVQTSQFEEFDADAVLAELQDVVGDDLRAFGEYDADQYQTLFVSDQLLDEMGSSDAVEALSEKLHADYRLDFTEKEMYEEVYADLGTVRAFGVFFDGSAVLRFVGERTGMYVSVALDAPFDRIVETVYDVIEEEEP